VERENGASDGAAADTAESNAKKYFAAKAMECGTAITGQGTANDSSNGDKPTAAGW
jgi:hypothetical protein